MKSRSDNTAPVKTKTGRGGTGLVKENCKYFSFFLLLRRIKASLRTMVGIKSTHHSCAQHSIHMDRRQPKQSGQQLTAAEVAEGTMSRQGNKGTSPSCSWPSEEP